MRERLSYIAGGVQHVGGHHEIEATRRKALLLRRLLEIQRLEAKARVRWREFALRAPQERARYVGKDVFVRLLRRERAEHDPSRAARTGADLQNTETSAGFP